MANRNSDIHQPILPLLSYQDYGDFISCFKRQDLNTHATEQGRYSLVEILQQELQQKLFVVHRLDKGTSGLILLAKNAEAAAELSALFEARNIKKTYYFLTDRSLSEEKTSRKSLIEKRGNKFVSEDSSNPNSHTDFELIKNVSGLQLWKALPSTGKPHQIRLHAKDLGIPILGDSEHNGSPAWRMFLQAQELEFNFRSKSYHLFADELNWIGTGGKSESIFYPDSESNSKPESIPFKLEQAWSTRKQIFGDIPKDQCFRLVHCEDLDMRVDKLGDVLWVYWYFDQPPTDQQIATISNWAKQKNLSTFVVKMNNRGKLGVETQMWNPDQIQATWTAKENHLHFEFRNNTGLSAGLFLDQRQNRNWVLENSKSKKVLNLFSYTSGFSVAAAVGEASEVVTVDVSAKFLEWSKKNFALNQIELKDTSKYQFFCQDVMLFLKGTQKRQRKFDLVVCDPPSMGRSKEGVFSLKKDWKELIAGLIAVTEKNGIILFSTNFEVWSRSQLKQMLESEFKEFVEVLDTPTAGLDYETPDQESLMKSFLLKLKK